MFSKISVLALFCVAGFASCEERVEQPNLVSFGDFMEFDVGLHSACQNVTGSSDITWNVIVAFQKCTSSIQGKDTFEHLAAVCQNRDKYLSCWDKMKMDVVKNCGAHTAPTLASVYRATVASLCANDNGAKRIADMKTAFAEIRPGAEAGCPEQTGVHWIENCKDFVPAMNSPNLCTRHAAIDKCLEKITCDNIKFAKLVRQMYTDGRALLKCN